MTQLDPWTNSTNDKTLRRYRFPCRVDVKRRSVKQGTKGGISEFNQVYLIPDVSHSGAVDFLNAWLLDEVEKTKDGKPKYVELLINVENEFGSFRVGLCRDNEYYYEAIHLVVMSKFLEEKLENSKGKLLNIVALESVEDTKEDRTDELDSNKHYNRVGSIPTKIGEIT